MAGVELMQVKCRPCSQVIFTNAWSTLRMRYIVNIAELPTIVEMQQIWMQSNAHSWSIAYREQNLQNCSLCNGIESHLFETQTLYSVANMYLLLLQHRYYAWKIGKQRRWYSYYCCYSVNMEYLRPIWPIIQPIWPITQSMWLN